jgi:TrmH family RNA methyltransferase
VNADSVSFVLVRPARAQNIASAARALANMGFSQLTLVHPPDDLDEQGSHGAAYGAWEILEGARRADSLAEAVGDATWVVATSGKPSVGAMLTPRELAAAAAPRLGGGMERLAIVFGPERTGLRNDELALCHDAVRIPASAAQPSLNLAHAVLVVAYELSRAFLAPAPQTPVAARPTTADMEAVLSQWRTALERVGYLREDSPGRLLAELRRLLARTAASPRELNLLRGIARQITWAAENTSNPRVRQR